MTELTVTELNGEQQVLMLTQDDCPGCERLKQMLARPLRGQFGAHIRTVHRTHDAEEFAQLVHQHGLRSTPALIHVPSGAVLTRTESLGEVKAFLGRAG